MLKLSFHRIGNSLAFDKLDYCFFVFFMCVGTFAHPKKLSAADVREEYMSNYYKDFIKQNRFRDQYSLTISVFETLAGT